MRQIPAFPANRKAAIEKILAGMAEQHIIIRFKPDLPARTQKGFVFFQLAGMGQPLFKMSWTGPGIAEINKNSLHRILTGQNLINALDT